MKCIICEQSFTNKKAKHIDNGHYVVLKNDKSGFCVKHLIKKDVTLTPGTVKTIGVI